MSIREHKVIATMPVAKFWYTKSEHRHPVRRTILIIEESPTHLTGYELRCGNTVRTYRETVLGGFIRSYKKAEVTRYGQYCCLRETSRYKSPTQTTMRRLDLLGLVKEGI